MCGAVFSVHVPTLHGPTLSSRPQTVSRHWWPNQPHASHLSLHKLLRSQSSLKVLLCAKGLCFWCCIRPGWIIVVCLYGKCILFCANNTLLLGENLKVWFIALLTFKQVLPCSITASVLYQCQWRLMTSVVNFRSIHVALVMFAAIAAGDSSGLCSSGLGGWLEAAYDSYEGALLALSAHDRRPPLPSPRWQGIAWHTLTYMYV